MTMLVPHLRADKKRHTALRDIEIQNLRLRAADEIERLREAANALLTNGEFWAEINDCGVEFPKEAAALEAELKEKGDG